MREEFKGLGKVWFVRGMPVFRASRGRSHRPFERKICSSRRGEGSLLPEPIYFSERVEGVSLGCIPLLASAVGMHWEDCI